MYVVEFLYVILVQCILSYLIFFHYVQYVRNCILYLCLYIFYPIFTVVYIVERLVLQTIYLLNKESLQFVGPKSVVYDQELGLKSTGGYNIARTVYIYGKINDVLYSPVRLISTD